MSDLATIQQQIVSIRSERGFTTDPVRMLALLVEEVGEVAGEIKKTWSPNYPELNVADVANELADVFVLVSALASSFDIDLATAVHDKFVNADATRSWASQQNV